MVIFVVLLYPLWSVTFVGISPDGGTPVWMPLPEVPLPLLAPVGMSGTSHTMGM